jgi:superfamily I DNA/RNA helicase
LKGFGNMQVAGRDSVTAAGVRGWIKRGGLDVPDPDFDDALYTSFRRYLRPPLHTLEQGVPLEYPGKQAELIVSRPGQQKVRGVAGSGKTMVLARRAVNALKRTGSRVLVLTYNITLCNYIHDKISQVRENFRWDDFCIIHYHEFFKSMANNLGLPITGLGDFDREDFFEPAADRTPRFAAIFVDEVQDYKVEWLRGLRKYFLREGGEFVLFGDEKQNIYSRALEADRRIRTNIPGRWNELTASFRLSEHIVKLATAYQRHFFEGRYELDAIEVAPERRGLFDLPQHFRYFDLSGEPDCVEAVNRLYCSVSSEYSIHPNDVCIVSSRTALLREVDYLIRTRKREKTKTMFESKEVYDCLCGQIEHPDELEEAVQAVRKARKFHFWMNPGTVKLATIHSFKGWEINTLIVVVCGGETATGSEGTAGGRERISDEELVYTAITRCRHNLFVANLGDRKYHDFFSRVKAAGN